VGVAFSLQDNGVSGQAYQKPLLDNMVIAGNNIILGTNGRTTSDTGGMTGIVLYGANVDTSKRIKNITIRDNSIQESGYPANKYPDGIRLQVLNHNIENIFVTNNRIELPRYDS